MKNPAIGPIFGGSNTRLVRKGPEPQKLLPSRPHGKGGLASRLFRTRFATALLAEMPPPVLAAEPGAGDADKAVAAGVFLAADREVAIAAAVPTAPPTTPAATSPGQKLSVIVPAVVAVAPGAVPIGLIAIGLTLVAAAIVGASRSTVLAIGVWIKLRAIAGIVMTSCAIAGLASARGSRRRRGFRILSWGHSVAGVRGKRPFSRSFRCSQSG